MNEIEKLANFIMANIEGEPSQSEGAGTCAIRIIKDIATRLAEVEKERDGFAKGVEEVNDVAVEKIRKLQAKLDLAAAMIGELEKELESVKLEKGKLKHKVTKGAELLGRMVKQLESRKILCEVLMAGKSDLQADIERLKGALEKKVVKCCETCDSFITHDEAKSYSTNLDMRGRCPFDSQEHKNTDTCDKWNIKRLAKAGECEKCGGSGFIPDADGFLEPNHQNIDDYQCTAQTCEDWGICKGKKKAECSMWKPCPDCKGGE